MLDVLGSWYFVNLRLIPVLWNLKGRAIYARPAAEIVQVITYEGARGEVVVKTLPTNWQVAGSIPVGVIGSFQWHNPSGRTMVLGSTQPLTEMSFRCISWG